MNKYNRKVKEYLYTLYPREKDRGQIKDLFESMIDLPGNYINPDGFLSILKELERNGYKDDFLNVTIKVAQGIRYHNEALIQPYKDFSFIQDGVYLDRNDVLALCENIVNPRDKVLMLGEFEGLHGKDMIELLEIKEEDIFEGNMIYIRSRDEFFKASDELVRFLKEASEQNEYVYLSYGKDSQLVPLIDNGTMLKKLSKGKSSEQRLIYQNLIRIGSLLGFSGNITYRHIRNCGKKYYLDELCEEHFEDPKTALKNSIPVRDAYFKRFGLKSYISLNKMMEPIDKLIPRPK